MAIPPISRLDTAKFKFSMAAYSYRDLLTGTEPPLSLFDFVEECARMGLEGTELTSYYFPEEVDRAYLLRLKKRCFELGLDVSGTAVGNDFGVSDSGKRREQVDLVRRWVDFAEILGAPVIRIFAGQVPAGASPAETHARMVAEMEACCDYAGQHGVFLALENHGGPTETVDGLMAFVRDVQSPWFGVNLDTGNFHSEDIYGDLQQLAPFALNVQVKAVTSGPDGIKKPSDFRRLAGLLRQAGYRGYIVLEFEEPGDPRIECPRLVRSLREAFHQEREDGTDANRSKTGALASGNRYV